MRLSLHFQTVLTNAFRSQDYVGLGAQSFPLQLNPSYLSAIGRQYLDSEAYSAFVDQCQTRDASVSDLTSSDIHQAINEAIPRLYAYIAADEQVRQSAAGGPSASRFISTLAYESQLFTLITQNLVRRWVDKVNRWSLVDGGLIII